MTNYARGDEKLVRKARRLAAGKNPSRKDEVLLGLASAVQRLSAELHGGTSEGDKGLRREYAFTQEVLGYRMSELDDLRAKHDALTLAHAPWDQLSDDQKAIREETLRKAVLSVLKKAGPALTKTTTVMVNVGMLTHLPAQEAKYGIIAAEARGDITVNTQTRNVALAPLSTGKTKKPRR